MQKVFLTGSTGLIGKELYKNIKEKYKVIRISNNKKKLNNKILYCNYSSLRDLRSFLKKNPCPDLFIHSGWGKMTEPNDKYHINQNIKNFKNIVNEFYRNGLKKFIFIGTINEYGQNNGKVKENRKPIGNLRNYEKGKIECGKIGKRLSKIYNKIFIHIRLANIYGPIKRENSLIHSLHSAKKKNVSPKVSPLKFYRDYMHSSEAAIGIQKVFENCSKSLTVNIGSGKKILMRDFVKIYWKILGGSKPILFQDNKDNKAIDKGYYLDISLLKKITKWKSQLNEKDGIKKNIKYYK